MGSWTRASFGLVAVILWAALCGITSAEPERPAPANVPRIAYKFGREAQIGFTILHQGGHVPLTYSDTGETSSTLVRIDGHDLVFGSGAGDWHMQHTPLAKSKEGRVRHGHWCVWGVGKIKVTQVVEILPSHTGQLDTCLVFYVLENSDKQPRQVGLRTMIDTQIAANDGNSFGLAGRAVTSAADFKTAKDMPTFIEVRETSDPKRPGFLAYLTVKVGNTFEAPDRCSLTHWPGPSRVWDVPMESIDGDAAVAMYWNQRRIDAGGRRLIGYAYGQGVFSFAKTSK